MWEYDRIIIKFRIFQELINELNKLGAEDWEIINYKETQPQQFGGEWECVIIIKKEKKDENT